MKFSVLLPTRNRLELLRYAVETVRRQDYDDWEIIISDNFSEEDIAGYVRSLNDPRIKYYRTDRFIPVTDNWNNALEKSSGDYVIMLGDDDGLMKGYFSTIRRLADEFGSPDFFYTGAYIFAYPGVIPSSPDGFLLESPMSFGRVDLKKPFLLPRETALRMADHSLNFRVRFGYNMQFSVVSRRFIRSLEKYGAFYQSPYPDYYASNTLMLKADHVLVVPRPLVAIGISPKSFGYFYFNSQERKGAEFLQNWPDKEMRNRLEKVVLPGSDMNTSWLFAMETIRLNFGHEFNIKVNYRQYRALQIVTVFKSCVLDDRYAKTERQKLWGRMKILEKLLFGVPLLLVLIILSCIPKRLLGRILRLHPWQHLPQISGSYKTVLDVFEYTNPTSTDKDTGNAKN